MKSIYIVLVTLLLAGCATQYTFDGKIYSGKDNFLVGTRQIVDEAVESIQPLQTTLAAKNLIFALPNASTMRSNELQFYQKRHQKELDPAHYEILDTILSSHRIQFEGMAKAIERRKIYQSVKYITIDSVGSIPEPSADTDVLYLLFANGNPAQWYYISKKSGQQVFAFDKAVNNQKEGMKSFVDAAQAYALRD